MNSYCCWHFEIHWLVASGFQVQQWLQIARSYSDEFNLPFRQIPASQVRTTRFFLFERYLLLCQTFLILTHKSLPCSTF
jgi:hypothetical protein